MTGKQAPKGCELGQTGSELDLKCDKRAHTMSQMFVMSVVG